MEDKFRDYLGAVNTYGRPMIGFGSYSDVYSCDYLDWGCAYKEFVTEDYVKFIKERLYRIVEKGCCPNVIIPNKFIYKKPEDEFFKGYVMNSLESYDLLDDLTDLSIDKKISILKKAREIVDNFHNTYNCVHANITPWKFMLSSYNGDLQLIDPDTNISLEKKDVVDINKYKSEASYYISNIGVDKGLDIFLFNLSVYSILNNKNFFECLSAILNSEYGIFEENEKVKNIFDSYKDLDCKKSLKKEYVIDYM